LRRSQDYYVERALIWLEADAIIRERAGAALARRFPPCLLRPARYRSDRRHVHARGRRGRSGGRSAVRHAVIESRVYAVNAAAPTRGFDASGWRLIYNALPNADKFIPPLASPQGVQMFTIGALVRNDGTIDDVVAGSPAYEAGLGPHMSIVSVNGRSFIAR
jgi:predicted metalloprotease with PDZ domain